MNAIEQKVIILATVQFIGDLCQVMSRVLEAGREAVDQLGDTLEKLDEGGAELLWRSLSHHTLEHAHGLTAFLCWGCGQGFSAFGVLNAASSVEGVAETDELLLD